MFRLGNKKKKLYTILIKGLIIEYEYTKNGLQIIKGLQ